MSDDLKQYREAIDAVNRATDEEIAEAMRRVLEKQGQRNVLRPGRRKALEETK